MCPDFGISKQTVLSSGIMDQFIYCFFLSFYFLCSIWHSLERKYTWDCFKIQFWRYASAKRLIQSICFLLYLGCLFLLNYRSVFHSAECVRKLHWSTDIIACKNCGLTAWETFFGHFESSFLIWIWLWLHFFNLYFSINFNFIM